MPSVRGGETNPRGCGEVQRAGVRYIAYYTISDGVP